MNPEVMSELKQALARARELTYKLNVSNAQSLAELDEMRHDLFFAENVTLRRIDARESE